MTTKKYEITGMTCASCVAHVEKSVAKLGVDDVAVSLLTNSMNVTFDESRLESDAIEEAVKKAGYGAAEMGGAKETAKGSAGRDERKSVAQRRESELDAMKHRLIFSICFLIPLMYVSMHHMTGAPLPHALMGAAGAAPFALTQLLLTLPVIYLNRKYYVTGFPSLFRGAPNMDSLIAVGSGAALVYGVIVLYLMCFALGRGDMESVGTYRGSLYFESAAMILTLVTLGKFLETRSRGKTGEAIEKLMDLAPKTASVVRDGVESEVPVEYIAPGDIIVIRPGNSIPVDGVITEGGSSLDESSLTGESVPVYKQAGDTVRAGVMNINGAFKFKATRVGDDTTLAQMIRLVEEASSGKAPIARTADRVAGVFVPVVIGIALVAFVIWLIAGQTFEFAISTAISVLVISCPCALGLATPVAIMAGAGKGAEHGILISSAEALETASSLDTVVLDKTGTLTVGKPRLTDVKSYNMSENELLTIAASLEAGSEHPLSEAVTSYAIEHGIAALPISDFNAIPGKGVEGTMGGERVAAGNAALLAELGVDPGEAAGAAQRYAQDGKTPLFVTRGASVAGVLAAADTLKPTSASAIKGFSELGIETIMLTGDNRLTAEAIRRELSIENAYSEVLPTEKEQVIRTLQQEGKRVAMIGDGINDAPALARADVGVAIGAGSDVAIDSADIVLMKNDLNDAVTAVQLSRAVMRNIKQNLFWAFFYNAIGIPLAAGVFYSTLGWHLNPMFGAAAMSLSSVCVVSNALRLKLFKPSARRDTPEISKVEERKEIKMEKKLTIEGMMCAHCSGRVEKALNALEGVSARVALEEKAAYVTADAGVSADALKAAVEDAGYEVTGIE